MSIINRKKMQKSISEELDSLLDFDNEKQKIQFEELLINNEAIQVIQELMRNNLTVNTKAQLARKIGVTEAYISKLFSGKKYINVSLLAKIQRLFNMRFKIMDQRKIPASNIYIFQPKGASCDKNLPEMQPFNHLSKNKSQIHQIIN